MKYLFVIFLFLVISLTVGKDLLPFQSSMFVSHDSTQPARILDFSFNLYNFQIPPRLAPHWSFGYGFPVFNFYAPTAYWISSFFHLLGLDVIDTLKISYLLSTLVALESMYLFLRRFFSTTASILGGVLYAFSPWVAVEIFVRGNLAEMWFIALLPLGLYMLHRNAHSNSTKNFILTCLMLCLLFTVHNVLSLFGVVLSLIAAALQKNPRRNTAAIIIGLLLSSYFLIPAIIELPLTYAADIAQQTKYSDHFLCAWQLWTTPMWGYGGSAPGCSADGMSFMIGKLHIIFGFLGLGLLILKYKKLSAELRLISIFIALLGITTAFLTTYTSQFIWDTFSAFALFQFPWRLIIFPLFACTYFAAFFFHHLKLPFMRFFLIFIAILYLFQANKYFHPPLLSRAEYSTQYASEEFLTTLAAYAVPEYLPRTVEYKTWLAQKNKQREIYNGNPYVRTAINGTLPVYSFTFWKVNTQTNPHTAIYEQSSVQKLSNIITMLTLVGLGILAFVKRRHE